MSKKYLILTALLLSFCINAFAQQKMPAPTGPQDNQNKQPVNNADGKSTIAKHWALSLEAGSGNILGLSFTRQNLSGPVDIGVGAGFNFQKQDIEAEKYNVYYINGNVFSRYKFIDKNSFQISGRLQLGFNFLSAGGTLSTQSWELTPGALIGFKNMYAAFSCALLLTKEFTYVPQIGLGYRFQF